MGKTERPLCLPGFGRACVFEDRAARIDDIFLYFPLFFFGSRRWIASQARAEEAQGSRGNRAACWMDGRGFSEDPSLGVKFFQRDGGGAAGTENMIRQGREAMQKAG